MNIKERQNILSAITHTKEFNKSIGGVNKHSNFNWDMLTRPPLLAYLPQHVIDQIYSITTSVRLMNKPSEKYKLMNECLAPYRFRPLNSGTNRRVFYCEYDPTVVIKIGSDNVGRNDNILEYHMADKLKPFCAKPFDLHPSGVMMLTERVEPISEEDFKENLAGNIFDLIFSIISRGYIMEDIGANFYKNWGFRFEFGPVLIDYPYLYEIDWSKLRCSFIDPHTGLKCDGLIDYNYDSGLSELICTKCGTRYSANYLAKLVPTDVLKSIVKEERKLNMAGILNPKNLKVSIVQGDKVIRRFYNETEIYDDVNRSRNIDIVNNNISQQKPSDYRNEYGKAINDKIIKFLSEINAEFGKKPTISLAKRLGVYYRFENRYENITTDNHDTGIVTESASIGKSMVERVKQYKNQNVQKQPKVESIDPQKDIKELVEEYTNTNSNQSFMDLLKNTKYDPSTNNSNRPTNNLNLVKPESREEREARENSARGSKEIMGIPSIPGTELMKYKQELPKIKSSVERNLNGFEQPSSEKEQVIEYLETILKEKVTPLIGRILSDTSGIKYNVSLTVDTVNKECYKIQCYDRESYIFECTVYPGKIKEETNKEQQKTLTNTVSDNDGNNQLSEEERIMKLLDNKALQFDFSKYNNDTTVCKNKLKGYLTSVLLDTKKVHPARAMKYVNKWIDTKYNHVNLSDEL